jgi:protein involved in polysaccharide export with SLBB domain
MFVLFTATALLFVSCAGRLPETAMQSPTAGLSTQPPREYTIEPGDHLDIKFFYNPELNETVTVRPDGMISLQLIDDVKAAGMRPSDLDAEITEKYSVELQKPMITVIVRSFSAQKVYVGGEVNVQGLIDLRPGMTPLQAVLNAGGFKETASPSSALVIRKGEDDTPTPIRVNLKQALYGTEMGQLQPHDVVYVPKSFIAEANKFVNQYVEQLFLFKGISLGFSYLLNSTDDVIVR